jgi:hypothetical protein
VLNFCQPKKVKVVSHLQHMPLCTHFGDEIRRIANYLTCGYHIFRNNITHAQASFALTSMVRKIKIYRQKITRPSTLLSLCDKVVSID